MDHVILEQHCDVVLQEDDGGARAGVPEQPLPDRAEERAGPRGARAPGDRTAGAHPRLREGGRDPVRLLSAASCRSSSAPRKARTASSARERPRRSSPAASEFELDGEPFPMDSILIEELKEEYERLSADGFRVLAIASKEIVPRGVVAGDATPYGKADERDLDPERLRRVPRPAQGDRRRGHQGAAGPRRRRQGRHRRQRTRRAQDLQGGRARRPSSCSWEPRSRR